MKIVLCKSEDMDDWFTIVRAEHDGRTWFERTGQSTLRYMCSERLSPEACIEGNAMEMIALGNAIKNKEAISFKRCAVSFESDGVHFRSPRNSQVDAVVSEEDAENLADQIADNL